MDTAQPPKGYVAPQIIWCVESEQRRAGLPDNDDGLVTQLGAFTTKAAAKKLMRRLKNEDRFPNLRINIIGVHERVKDWEWDR